MSKRIALILAGGRGTRFNSMRPKQYFEVDGKPVIYYTMKAFERHPGVTDIYVVCSPEWNEYIEAQAGLREITKFRGCLRSGNTSFLSMRSGVDALVKMGQSPDSIVMVHDAVRPLLTQDVITNNIIACEQYGNAITVIYSNESYMKVSGGVSGTGYALREEYMRAQTPHTFRLGDLCNLLAEADAQGVEHSQSLFTLVNELDFCPLYIAQGDIINFKITQPQDLKIFRALKNI